MYAMNNYNGKKVAIIGISVEGVDSALFFHEQGAVVGCFDRKPLDALGNVVSLLPQDISYHTGPDAMKDLSSYDIIVRSPGVHPKLPELVQERLNGKIVTSLTQLFLEHCPAPVIGVTGTKGKGTTSTLIYEMLTKGGKSVYLGGNVGVPLLSKVTRMKKTDWVVLELSSFQLEDVTISPHIAVVLKITQDHLANFDTQASNFHETREHYVLAKKPIVLYQTEQDIAILQKDDPTSSSFAQGTKAKILFFSRSNTADAFVDGDSVFVQLNGKAEKVVSLPDIKLRGKHNLENIAAATLASIQAGVDLGSIQHAAREFKGLPYRLEEVGVKHGVTYINDSFSTVPDTTIAAIEAFSEPKVLIVGGSEKGADFHELGVSIANHSVKCVIVIGDMTKRITDAVTAAGFTGQVIPGLGSMHDIVVKASEVSAYGDVVLLSPACASFDMFKNYKDRGEQFRYEVSLL